MNESKNFNRRRDTRWSGRVQPNLKISSELLDHAIPTSFCDLASDDVEW